jgi:hypothetical protein
MTLKRFIIIAYLMVLPWSSASAEENYLYINELGKTSVSSPIYAYEKDLDLFDNYQAPAGSFNVVPVDLNADGQQEFFVSNPMNNGLFAYFWRIYQRRNKTIKPIGELFCTSVRLSQNTTDGYKDIECYSYLSLAEGYIHTFKHFGDEYFLDSKKRVLSRTFYIDGHK